MQCWFCKGKWKSEPALVYIRKGIYAYLTILCISLILLRHYDVLNCTGLIVFLCAYDSLQFRKYIKKATDEIIESDLSYLISPYQSFNHTAFVHFRYIVDERSSIKLTSNISKPVDWEGCPKSLSNSLTRYHSPGRLSIVLC